MTWNGFTALTPSEAEADLNAAAARAHGLGTLTVTSTRPPSTTAERLREAHRQHVEANTRLLQAERERDLATSAVNEAELALTQAKEDLIEDTLSLYYGAHH